MFGTIMPDYRTMSKEQRARYGACYCGLCQQLDAQFGSVGYASLTYDMTFLSILHGALYNLPETEDLRRCVPHPVKAHPAAHTLATAYAADMNLFFAYYQCLDDWQDDRNQVAREKSRLMEKYLPEIRRRWPRQCAAIEDGLAQLGEMEKANELNPDLPANCFGRILGEAFCWQQDVHAPALRAMGAALGRYVYLLDAVNDLRADLKKQRYNPLVAQMNTDFTPILTMMMAECTEVFDKLPLHRDEDILQNVLYAGVWQRYRRRGGREERE